MRKLNSIAGVAGLAQLMLLAGVSTNLWAQGLHYNLTNLGAISFTGLNNNGQVVGHTGDLVVWDSVNGLQDLGAPPGCPNPVPTSINDAGQITGTSCNQPFFWDKSIGFLEIGPLPKPFGIAFSSGITDSGEIVGTMDTTFSPVTVRAFSWNRTTGVQDLGTPCPDPKNPGQYLGNTEGNGISRSGVFVSGGVQLLPGQCSAIDTGLIPAIWSFGTWTTFSGFAGSTGTVNNVGQVVGTGYVVGSAIHAVVWCQNGSVDLGTLPGDIASEGTDFNDSGQVVGRSWNAVVTRAFVWDATNGMQDLNTLIPPNSGMVLIQALAINNAGQILANSDGGNYFLLSPISCQVPLSPPFSISSSVPGYLYQLDDSHLINGAPGWASYPLGQSQNTIGGEGCLLTAVTMAINTADPNGQMTLSPPRVQLDPYPTSFVNPESLDIFLTPTFFEAGGALKGIDNAVEATSNSGLRFAELPGGQKNSINDPSATAQLAQALCQNKLPVLVGVKLIQENNGTYKAHHFVLVTGVNTVNGSQTFAIADPGNQTVQSLNGPPWNGQFLTRGIVTAKVGGNVSGLDMYVDNNAELLVIDPAGNQTGVDASGNLLQNIAQSAHFADGLDDESSGDIVTGFDMHTVQIYQPLSGTYSIVLSGLASGPYSLTVAPYSMNGGAQQAPVAQGRVAAPGATITYSLTYDPTGANPPALLAGTATGLTSTPNPSKSGQSVTFTATVTSSGSGAPTGMITFMDGTSALGTSALDGNAVATLATASLSVGTHSITAAYSGDTGFSASVSTPLSQVVAQSGGTFTLAVAPPSNSVTAGQPASYSLTVTPISGFNQTVSLSCTVAPAGPNCSVSPASVTLDGINPSPATLQVTTVAPSAAASSGLTEARGNPLSSRLTWLLPLVATSLIGVFTAKYKTHRTVVGLAIAVLLFSAGCGSGGSNGGGNSGTPPGSYIITVMGASGTTNQSTQVTLVVK